MAGHWARQSVEPKAYQSVVAMESKRVAQKAAMRAVMTGGPMERHLVGRTGVNSVAWTVSRLVDKTVMMMVPKKAEPRAL